MWPISTHDFKLLTVCGYAYGGCTLKRHTLAVTYAKKLALSNALWDDERALQPAELSR